MAFNRPIPDRKPHAHVASGVGAVIEAEKLMQIALLLPSAALIGWLAGVFLDSRLHQSWIAIFGVVFGCISGLVYVIRMAMAAERNSRTGEPGGDGPGKGSGNPQS
jgi:F0F1-type ATP synthase assembly protein I